MKRFHSFLLLTICVLCGCSDLSETIVAPTVDEQKLSETITPMQALDLLNSTLNSIDGGTKSSSCQLDPNNLIPLGRKNLFSITKSGDSTYDMPDTLLYAINLPEGGYSILNAQRSASTPVFCITDKGEIGVEDFMEALTLINSGRRTKTEINSADDDSFEELGPIFVPMVILSSAINQYNGVVSNEISDININTRGNSTITVTKYGPYLNTKWHQDSPFNDFRSDGAPAGCVAIATAQILQYNRNGNPDNKNFNWNLMNGVCNISDPYNLITPATNNAKNEVSRFLEYVGARKNGSPANFRV